MHPIHLTSTVKLFFGNGKPPKHVDRICPFKMISPTNSPKQLQAAAVDDFAAERFSAVPVVSTELILTLIW